MEAAGFATAGFIAEDTQAGAVELRLIPGLAGFPPTGRVRLDWGCSGQEDAEFVGIRECVMLLASPTTQPHAARSCVSLLDEVG